MPLEDNSHNYEMNQLIKTIKNYVELLGLDVIFAFTHEIDIDAWLNIYNNLENLADDFREDDYNERMRVKIDEIITLINNTKAYINYIIQNERIRRENVQIQIQRQREHEQRRRENQRRHQQSRLLRMVSQNDHRINGAIDIWQDPSPIIQTRPRIEGPITIYEESSPSYPRRIHRPA
jgi:hypothetical protein